MNVTFLVDIYYFIFGYLGMPSLEVGLLFKFRNVSYLYGRPVYSHYLKPIFSKKILDNKNDTGMAC